MLKNLIVLPDGTEIFSGAGTVNALQRVTITQQVNTGTELTLGSTCANMLEATLITPEGGLHIAAGTEITLYKVTENGARTKVGLFTVEKPTRPSANLYKLTAYDRVSWLDRDLSQWLQSLDGWPYTLHTFAKMVCTACGLTLTNASLPNGAWEIKPFFMNGITGRRLMQWIGQACGRFCRATVDGKIEFAWYTPKNISVTPQDLHGLRLEDYQVAPVDKVQISLTGTDVGAIYGEGTNAYVITGNCLLATDSAEALQGVARVLYERLQAVTYTPCKVKLPATMQIQAGDIIQLTDRKGQQFTAYVMTKTQSGQWDTLECTGSANRASCFTSNAEKIGALNGKMLEIQTDLDGVQIVNREMVGKIVAAETAISQNTEQILLRATKTEVQSAKEDAIETSRENFEAQLRVMSDSISMNITKTQILEEDVGSMLNGGVSRVVTSTGYTFDDMGMTVEKSGREIKTRISEDGMQVFKNGSAVLTANSEGVDAVDLHASTYLAVGGRSRFENYGTDRTGCFWIGG